MFEHDILQPAAVLSSSDEGTSNTYIEFRSYYQVADPNILINTDANAVRGSTAILNNTTYIVVYTSNGSTYTARVNGNQETITDEVSTNDGKFFGDISDRDNVTIGSRKTSSNSQFMHGKIAEAIVYDDITLSLTDIQDMENSLASKYGITLS